VSFSLRGVSLAAMDINIVGKNSSDPYYILYAVDASGQLKRLGKSNTVKADLNPSWEVLELTSEDMGGARRLKVLSPTPIALTLTPTLAPSPNPTLALTPTLTLTRCCEEGYRDANGHKIESAHNGFLREPKP
jgi:hypothetical protein